MFTNKRSAGYFAIIIILISMACIFYLSRESNMNKPLKSKSAINMVLPQILDKKTPVIQVEEAYKNRAQYIFLDTRSKPEFNVSHIAGARYVGFEDFDISRIQDLPKKAAIILYCSVGKRSDAITRKAMENGFINVRNMYGGIFQWVNNGYPVVNLKGNVTDSVHAYNHLWGLLLKKGKKVYD